ncbi:hypothetical protein LY76DRAFT_280920 [Colletotrichum caudatum]|nr:hypothetical protein LY76DRAFT_280920 [Colletotrichum caudatum]
MRSSRSLLREKKTGQAGGDKLSGRESERASDFTPGRLTVRRCFAKRQRTKGFQRRNDEMTAAADATRKKKQKKNTQRAQKSNDDCEIGDQRLKMGGEVASASWKGARRESQVSEWSQSGRREVHKLGWLGGCLGVVIPLSMFLPQPLCLSVGGSWS